MDSKVSGNAAHFRAIAELQGGIAFIIDADSLALVDGTEIDFLKQGLNEQFVFRNPNVAGECGCGESFTTEADRAA